MKIRIDVPILNFDGSSIETEITPARWVRPGDPPIPAVMEALTYRNVIENAINLQSDAQPLTAEKKLKAFQIGVRLNAKKLAEYDLTVDQIAFVKERVGMFYSPVVYGRFLQLVGDTAITPEEENEEEVETPKETKPGKSHRRA